MPEIKKVDTSKYTKEGKVDIDGNIWSVKLPGAGTELKISKIQRRLKLLEKKITAGTETEEDLDRIDEYEDFMLAFFKGLFTDDTEDNSQVSEWVENTPMAIIVRSFEDIKSQTTESDTSD